MIRQTSVRPLTLVLMLALALGVAPAFGAATAPDLGLPTLSAAQVKRFQEAEAAASKALQNKDWARASRFYQRALAVHGANEGAWYNLACAQALAGKADAAMASLEAALSAGWTDPGWPAQDSDLAPLHGTAAFDDWTSRVAAAAKAARVAAPPPAATLALTADDIAAGVTAGREAIAAVAPAMGSHARRAASQRLARWQAASWDAIANGAADPQARAEAAWSALRALTTKALEPSDPALAAEIAARAANYATDHPDSPQAGEARYARAVALFAAAVANAEDRTEARATLRSDLLLLAATEPPGAGLESALVRLIAMSEDDLPTASRLVARLMASATDREAAQKRVRSDARSVHYRLNGLPEFTTRTLDGKTVSPATMVGRVTLVDFWATWCGPCREELPHLKKAYAQFKDRGFEIVGISLDRSKDGDPAAFQAWCAENDVTWPQVFDGKHWDAEIARLFDVRGIPFALLLDRDGKVRFVDDDLRGEQLLDRVESLLEAPVGM